MRKKLFLITAVTALVSGLILGGCAKPAPAPAPVPAPAPKTLDIGVATPLTGPAANLGTNIQNAILLTIDDQNAQGGVTIAGQNYTLNAIIRDTKHNIVDGRNIAEELVFDKKVKVVAGVFIADGVGVQTITEPNKVLMFGTNCALPGMVGPNKPYSFFCSPTIAQMTYCPLAYIHEFYPEAKTVYCIQADIPTGPLFAAATENSCKLLGLKYLGYEKVPTTTKDFTPIIARVLTHNADIIDTGGVGGSMGGLGALLIKQLREAGFNGLISIPAAPPEDVVEELVPPESLDKVITYFANVDSPIVDPKFRDVMTRFEAKFNMRPIDIAGWYYNVMKPFFEFLNTQNTMDTTAWMEGFAKYRWQNLFGFESSWVGEPQDGINRRVIAATWVSEYRNGKPVTEFAAPIPYEFFVTK